MGGNVHQDDKDKLKATVDVAADQAIEVTQDDATKLKATVTQAEKDRTVTSGTVTASYNPETDDGIIPENETRETQNVLLYGNDSDNFRWIRLRADPATGFLRVNAYQAAKDRTVTGTVTVEPSGDMARLAVYDRNPLTIINNYSGSVAAHAWTTRWTYTVPANRTLFHSMLFNYISVVIGTAGKTARCTFEVSTDGGSTYQSYTYLIQDSATIAYLYETITSQFYLNEGEILRCRTFHDDSVNHGFQNSAATTEFDA